MTTPYRLSGPLDWVIGQQSNARQWDLLGSLAAEDRSSAAPIEMKRWGRLADCTVLNVIDDDDQFREAVDAKLEQRRAEYTAQFGSLYDVVDVALMSDVDELESLVCNIVSNVKESVLVDVSCLPKRIWFYLIKKLVQCDRIRNVTVCISSPEKYGERLTGGIARWEFLPFFGRECSDSPPPLLVVGIGYQNLQLLDVVNDNQIAGVRLIVPFPSKPPGAIRNWECVYQIQRQSKMELLQSHILRVHPNATSLAFELIRSHSVNRYSEVWLAPFGPKPISLAMLLLSIACEGTGQSVCVGYTQPLSYSAEYSTGVERSQDGDPVINGYCIKTNGRFLYSI